jgi:predicted Zn-dependent peptidase
VIMAHYGVKNLDGTYCVRTGLGWTTASAEMQYRTVTEGGKTKKIEREFSEFEIELIDENFVRRAAEEASYQMKRGLFSQNEETMNLQSLFSQTRDSALTLKQLTSTKRMQQVKPEDVVKLIHSIIQSQDESSKDEYFLEEINEITQTGISEKLIFKLTKGGSLKINLTSFVMGNGFYDVEVETRD